MSWTVLIPVRAPGKARLARGPEFARAIALDTIEAAVAGGPEVVVVTADAALAASATSLGARVVLEPAPSGLAAAIDLGLSDDGSRAVLLGDLPALDAADLVAALERASALERAFVPDADGTGSTLVTARGGAPFVHAFGPGSAQAHRDLGLVELTLPAESSLRRDVDLEEHLLLVREHLGPRTRSALAV
ncbi:MAG TPA: NTP transferase domain-containing protein [Pseudolysinimonas sp.]|nr:NTP transferase domain-containing protein [Pseudolysinimonas sp.]